MGPQEWCNVVSQAVDLGCESIAITGCEPLLEWPLVYCILDHAEFLGIDNLQLSTYGTLLTPFIVNELQCKGVVVNVRVVGLSEVEFEKRAAEPGAFSTFVQNVATLSASGVTVRVFVPKRMKARTEELCEFFLDLGMCEARFYQSSPKISVLCSERRLTKSAGCPRAQ